MSNLCLEPEVLNGLVTVQEASKLSGYSQQYLRRLLRIEKIKGKKIGNLWLIGVIEIQNYKEYSRQMSDQRFCPKMR